MTRNFANGRWTTSASPMRNRRCGRKSWWTIRWNASGRKPRSRFSAGKWRSRAGTAAPRRGGGTPSACQVVVLAVRRERVIEQLGEGRGPLPRRDLPAEREAGRPLQLLLIEPGAALQEGTAEERVIVPFAEP